jgi:hypothetical protein
MRPNAHGVSTMLSRPFQTFLTLLEAWLPTALIYYVWGRNI